MSHILAIETSTDICSVAIAAEESLVDLTINRPRIHAERLTQMIEFALETSSVSKDDLSTVAVSAGPGSYTGLRIGTSVAKGLAYPRERTMIAVPSLEVIAAAYRSDATVGNYLVVTRRARPGEIYLAVYRDQPKEPIGLETVAEPIVVSTDDMESASIENLPGGGWLIGPAPEALTALLGPDIRTVQETIRPNAKFVARQAASRLQKGETVEVSSFEPRYVQSYEPRKRSSIFDRLNGKS